jgi:predicted amidohydrolase YtcJ
MNRKSYLPYPDLVLFNGKIRTFAHPGHTCQALACSGGRIVATGDFDEIRRLAGPETLTLDLMGGTAIPGLTDAHVHLSEKGTAEMELVDCRDFYTDVHSIAEIVERLAKRAAETPAGS